MLNLFSSFRVILLAVFSVAALPSPVAYWDFEDSSGNTLADKSGNSAHGVITGSLGSVSGILGKALEFNGSSHVTIPSPPPLPQSFTFSAWVWQSSQNGDVPLIEFCCFSGYSGFHIWLNAVGATVTPGNIAFNLRPAPMPANAGTNTAAGILAPSQWHHVVLTFDSLTRTATVYADKVQHTTFTFSGIGNRPTVSGSPLYLGLRPSTSSDSRAGVRYTGRMDEIRIYASSMNASQVDSVYALSIPPVPQPDSGVEALPAPLARWDFEDSTGTQLRDQSGNGAHGIITGPVTNASGKWGKALAFNGATQVEIPDSLINLSASFTLSAWVWQASQSKDQPLWEFCCPSSYSGMHLWTNTTGNSTVVPGALQLNLRPDVATLSGFATQGSVMSSGAWNLVTVTYSSLSRKVRLYANRILRDSTTMAAAVFPGTGGSLYFGYRPQASSDSRRGTYFSGRMDEVTVYAAELNQAQINTLYFNAPPSRPDPMGAIAYWNFDDTSSTVLKDISGHGRHGAISGPASWVTGGPRGKALYFNGTTRVTIPADSSLGAAALTWVAWIRNSGGGDKTILSQKAASGWPLRHLWLSGGNSTLNLEPGTLMGEYGNDTVSGRKAVRSNARLNDGSWHQIAVTHDNGISKLYVDGSPDNTQTFSGGPLSVNAPLVLGGTGAPGDVNPWVGWMDEVAVYARALSAPGIEALYYEAIAVGVRGNSPARPLSAVRLHRIGSSSISLDGFGEGVTAQVDLFGPDGRLFHSWTAVRDHTVLDLSRVAGTGTRILRIRTSQGRVQTLKSVWLGP